MNERAAGAQAAGDEALDDLEIRVLEQPADLRRLVVLLNQVWGTVTPLVGVELLRAIDHTGGYVAGAFSQQRMVGGSLGFLGRHRDEIALHSHITGILPGVRHTGLGRQMKLHQREWAADQGLNWVTWTFDPLVRRNAWFNISVLGAAIDEYLVDFYGPMNDAINRNDPSDRLLAAWPTHGSIEVGDKVPPAVTGGADAGRHRGAAPHRPGRGGDVAAARARGAGRGDRRRRPGGEVHACRRVRRRPGPRVTGR